MGCRMCVLPGPVHQITWYINTGTVLGGEAALNVRMCARTRSLMFKSVLYINMPKGPLPST